MKVLVVGSGGREHVLVWKIKQSPLVKKIFCAPGNGGTAQIAKNVNIAGDDIQGLLDFAKKEKIDLTVVGPELPLVLGIVDAFEKENLKIFGPSKKAAQLEGSKVFAKDFMYDWDIPTAAYMTFSEISEAREFLNKVDFPVVIKADGLAAGKGVMICQDKEEAMDALEKIMAEKVFKDAGLFVVIEECLVGEEVSILAICDGESFCVLDSSQDHKRIFDDDLGPNTGGMGAYSPAPLTNQRFLDQVGDFVIGPVLEGMKKIGSPFKGVLYAGLMVTDEGVMVLEFNVRFGDPETQAVLPRLKNDLVEIMLASCEGTLHNIDLMWDDRSCVCVVMSSGGYPGKYEKGKEIKGIELAEQDQSIRVFHAGTKLDYEKLVTSGGRVLGVTGLGANLQEAVERTYEAVEKIQFDHCFFRRDIAAKAFKKMKNRISQENTMSES